MSAYPVSCVIASFSALLVIVLSIAAIVVVIGLSIVLRGYAAVELIELGYGANLSDKSVRQAVITALRARLFALLVGAGVLVVYALALWLRPGLDHPPAFYDAVLLALPLDRVARLRDLCAAHRPPSSSDPIFPLATGKIEQSACSIGAREMGMKRATFWRAYLIGL